MHFTHHRCHLPEAVIVLTITALKPFTGSVLSWVRIVSGGDGVMGGGVGIGGCTLGAGVGGVGETFGATN